MDFNVWNKIKSVQFAAGMSVSHMVKCVQMSAELCCYLGINKPTERELHFPREQLCTLFSKKPNYLFHDLFFNAAVTGSWTNIKTWLVPGPLVLT